MQRVLGIGLAMALTLGSVANAAEIDFIEDFALADDRAKVLEQLIPGTEEHSYYLCVLLQGQGKLDMVDQALAAWIKRHGYTGRVEQIRNRQALLRYERNPQASLEFIRDRLSLSFHHEREVAGKPASNPTRLDPLSYDRKTLASRAFSTYSDLSGFEPAGVDAIAAGSLDADRRRSFLQRITRPDVPDLAKLVVEDLAHRHSGGFGSFAIHRALTLAQLEECLKLRPTLKDDTNFIAAYAARLQPAVDVDWRNDATERLAYLERLGAYVRTLSPAHNSFRAHVLYQRLEHDRRQGIYDKARLLEYLKIPRSASYTNPEYLKAARVREGIAQLGQGFQGASLFPPVGDDAALVREALLDILARSDDASDFAPYVADGWLRAVLVEAKLCSGAPEPERWTALMNDATRVQALRDRIDIEFSPTCKTTFGAEEPVALDVDVKNVKTLIVKVFEIDSTGYYRGKQREIDLAVDLDGLVANEEKTHTYDASPFARVRRRFEFPTLARRGIFAIEIIGNGKSSRALVRKGQLRFTERTGASGHVFTVLDEANRKLMGATVFAGGREHKPAADGTILVPFTANPAGVPVVLTYEGFSTLERFRHNAETYALEAGIHVDRESLWKKGKAKLLVRPLLRLSGEPISLSLLEQPMLVVRATDASGVPSTKEIQGLTLTADRELVHELAVPEDLTSLHVTLKGRVKSLATGGLVDVADAAQVDVNRIDATDRTDDIHLARTAAGFSLAVLGKNGEPVKDRPVRVVLKHREFTQTVDALVQSDAQGRIDLGPLGGIARIEASGQEGPAHSWVLPTDRRTDVRAVHARAGDVVLIPYTGAAKEPTREHFALLERRGGGYLADRLAALSLEDGVLKATGLAAGSYALTLKETGAEVSIEVAPGEVRDGYVLGGRRLLEARTRPPLQIAAVDATDAEVRIRVKHAGAATRVHVIATRFLPAYPAYEAFALPMQGLRASVVDRDESFYVSGRDIGDEYRYILERRFAEKLPGNMLARPGLLLNPWAIRKTDTSLETVGGGGAYGSRAGAARMFAERAAGRKEGQAASDDASFANLDFLPTPSVVLANLTPDASGAVVIARKDLGQAQHLHVIALDAQDTVYRSAAIAPLAAAARDLRLKDGLDPEKHAAEQQGVTLLQSGESLAIADLTTSKVEIYDTLRRAYGLLSTLSSDAALAEFGFALDWPRLSADEKRAKYSKYACHELSFFVYRKDRPFFDEVVKPYLANKKDKTFMDRWLLGEDLARFLEPWAYQRLNVVERILLASRIQGEGKETERHIQDLMDMVPPDMEAAQRLFRTAIASSSLDADDSLGITGAREKAEAAKEMEYDKKSMDRASGPAGRAFAGEEAPMPMPSAAPPAPPAASAPGIAAGGRQKSKRALEADGALKDAAPSEAMAESADDEGGYDRDELEGKARDAKARRTAAIRPFYRRLGQTEEWAENNYYRLPIEAQTGELITVNGFWVDFAAHTAKGAATPFLSARFPEACRSFAEMMLALAVLDLPFEAGTHAVTFEGARMTLGAKSAAVVFKKELKESAQAKDAASVLVSQGFFRLSDRWRYERGERFEKNVTEEFLARVGYGCQVVVTNPTSARRKLEVLLQIPRGALPIQAGFMTRGRTIQLEPYATTTFEYAFYFPSAGKFAHFPVHVSKEGALLASAAPMAIKVVDVPTVIDTTSWEFISQDAPPDEVLKYLETANLGRLELSKIAWRMKDRAFFARATALLARRHAYDDTLWSYAIQHGDVAAAREFLRHADGFVSQTGAWIDTPLLTIDPVERHLYQHLEYSPLVNARAHSLGKRRTILNERLAQQYHALLLVLSQKPALDDTDRLAVAYFLLLQDRVEEGMRFFARVDAAKVASRLQHDYMRAFIDMYSADHKVAREIAEKHKAHPVDRWRVLFQDILVKLDEAEGKRPAVIDAESREQRQGALAATEEAFDFTVEAKRVNVTYQNLKECTVRYYLMDVELLFSRNPFVQQRGGQFSFVKPNKTATFKLPEGQTTLSLDLPAEFQSANLMVEVVAGGVQKAVPYFSNSLVVKTVESYGQLRVTRAGTGAPLAKAYVKAYARGRDGQVKFHKDGYTDLRGAFDYASLSTGDLQTVDRIAVLVMSETDGVVIREVAPPKE